MIRHVALVLVRNLLKPIWLGMSLAIRLAPRKDRRVKRVLLIAYNELTSRYVGEYAKLLSDEEELHLSFARAPFVDSPIETHQLESHLPQCRQVTFLGALVSWWDLIIVADHYPASLLHPSIPKVFVTHGLFAGRKFGDENYVYGRRCMMNDRPVYRRMLAAGSLERACALSVNSRLSDTIRVVGDPFADQLRYAFGERDDIRRRLGVAPHEKCILVMSSWGPESLIQSVGESLIQQANQLEDKYRLALSIHPNNYSRGGENSKWVDLVNRCRRSGWIIVENGASWVQYLAVADIFISDFTSLALYASLAGKPMIMMEFDHDEFLTGSPILQLKEIATPLRDCSLLADDLRVAETTFDKAAVQRFSHALVHTSDRAQQERLESVLSLIDQPDRSESLDVEYPPERA